MNGKHDPIVYLLAFIAVLIVLAGGAYGYLSYKLNEAQAEGALIKRDLVKLGDLGGKIDVLLDEMESDGLATRQNNVNSYCYELAARANIEPSISPRSENRGEGYVDRPYEIKIQRKRNQGGVSRSNLLTWLYDIETKTYRLKVTRISLTQQGNEPSDTWSFDGQVVHREPMRGDSKSRSGR